MEINKSEDSIENNESSIKLMTLLIENIKAGKIEGVFAEGEIGTMTKQSTGEKTASVEVTLRFICASRDGLIKIMEAGNSPN